MNTTFHYLAFGDSITSGNNVPRANRYPAVLARHLEHHTSHPIAVYNLGKSGLSSSKLLRQMHLPRVLEIIPHAQLITVCIGGDDLIYGYIKSRVFRKWNYLQKSMEKLQTNYDNICHLLKATAPSPVVMSTFYNPFPRTPLAVDAVRFCNERLIYPTAQKYGFAIADLYEAFEGREHQLLAHYRSGLLEDYRPFTPNSPIHPNVTGYRVIANRFYKLKSAPLF